MAGTRLAGPGVWVDRLDPHDLQKSAHPLAIDRVTFPAHEHQQAPASVNRMLQMQLVQAPHQPEIVLRLRARLVVEAAAGDAQDLALVPDAQLRAWIDELPPLFYRPSCLDFFLSQSRSTVSSPIF